MKLEAVLFDLVGTLVEESSNILNVEEGYYDIQVKAIHSSLEKDGISTDWSAFKNYYEKVRVKQKERSKQTLIEYDMCKRVSDTLHFFNYTVPHSSEIIQRAVDAYALPFINSLRIYQSTYDLLKTLTAKYMLGLVSNFAYSPGVHLVLDRFALKPFFTTLVISGEIGWKKPSHRIFKMALSQLSVEPKKAIFVGDDYEADIKGSKNAGMKSVWINRINEPLTHETPKPDYEISNLSELLEILI